MENSIKEFYTLVEKDAALKEKIITGRKKYEQNGNLEETLKAIAKNIIVPMAKEKGFNFTVDDLLNYEYKNLNTNIKELDLDDMKEVSGGIGHRAAGICLTVLTGLSSLAGAGSLSTFAGNSNTESTAAAWSEEASEDNKGDIGQMPFYQTGSPADTLSKDQLSPEGKALEDARQARKIRKNAEAVQRSVVDSLNSKIAHLREENAQLQAQLLANIKTVNFAGQNVLTGSPVYTSGYSSSVPSSGHVSNTSSAKSSPEGDKKQPLPVTPAVTPLRHGALPNMADGHDPDAVILSSLPGSDPTSKRSSLGSDTDGSMDKNQSAISEDGSVTGTTSPRSSGEGLNRSAPPPYNYCPSAPEGDDSLFEIPQTPQTKPQNRRAEDLGRRDLGLDSEDVQQPGSQHEQDETGHVAAENAANPVAMGEQVVVAQDPMRHARHPRVAKKAAREGRALLLKKQVSELQGIIKEADNLRLLAKAYQAGCSFDGQTFKLDDHIDAGGGKLPSIGTQKHPFSGTFNGQNHTVSHFSCISGLFGHTKNATIQNLNIENATITGTNNAGAIVGSAGYRTNVSGCRISGCRFKHGYNVGAVVGTLGRSSTVNSCGVDHATLGEAAGVHYNSNTPMLFGFVGNRRTGNTSCSMEYDRSGTTATQIRGAGQHGAPPAQPGAERAAEDNNVLEDVLNLGANNQEVAAAAAAAQNSTVPVVAARRQRESKDGQRLAGQSAAKKPRLSKK